jgi:RHS repeat-associated protein
VRTSFANISKGWSDLVAPAPPGPPAPPGQQTVQQAQQIAKDIRLVQQTIGGIMSLIALPKDILDIGFANLTAPLAAIFPSLPSATITTMYLGTPHAHSHPPSLIPPAPPIPLPSLGPVTLGTCVKVLINSLPAARVKDLGYAFTCGGLAPIFQIKTGSSNVFIGGHRAARMGDICVACVKGESRSVEAGAFMSALGTAASIASKGLQVAGMVAGLAGVVADAAQAAVEDDAAMASAMALAAAMGAAQMAADAVAMALSQTMGTDPGIPPSIGALLTGHPTVLIGGFPMIDIPNPINMILDKLSQFKAKSPPANGGCGKAGEPVDIVTGDNVDDSLDYESTGSMPLLWRRYYNSAQRNRWGPMGYGHRHQYQRELEFDADGFRYTDEKGDVVGFPPMPDGNHSVSSHGLTLRGIAPLVFRLQSSLQPAMDFQFQDVHSPALLVRMGSARNSLRFRYDAERKLTAIGDLERRIIYCDYDRHGQLVRLRLGKTSPEPDQILASYEYDAVGNLVKWTDALGYSANFAYDSDRRMVRKTDRRDYSYHYRYDRAGRCVHTYGDDGLYDVRFKFMPQEHCTQLTYSDGGVWTYLYNDTGTITEIIDPYGGIKTRKQDKTGRVIEEVSPGGRVTRLLYDSKGAHIGRLDSLGYVFPPWEQQPHPPNPLAHRLPGTPLEWECGVLLRPEEIRDLIPEDLQELPVDIVKIIADGKFSGAFRRPGDADPKKRYDALGRLIEEIDVLGQSRQWKYDPSGNMAEYTDADRATHRYEYASWNLLHRKIDPLGHASTFQYSVREKITKVVDPAGTTSEYHYDYKDRLIRVTRHGSVREEYRYDSGDNLIEKVDGTGNTLITLEPGPNGLASVRRLASGANHYFEYDDRGRFTGAATDEFAARLEYDPYGRLLLDKRDGRGTIHEFVAGLLSKTVVLDRFTTKYKFESNGWLNIVDPTGNNHRVRANSRLIYRNMSNGSSEVGLWDRTGRCLLKTYWSSRNPETRWTRFYEYSGSGNLMTVMDNMRGSTRYEYDRCHRIIAEILPDRTPRLFQYDAAGNILLQPGLQGVTLDSGNRLRTANGDRFTYDSRNHISRREGRTSVTRFDYDSLDMLIRVTNGTSEWEARYDPLGRRVSKSWSDDRVEFFWDKDRLSAEVRRDGRLRVYIYPNATSLVPFIFVDYENINAPPESGQRYFIFTNQIGVPIRVEDDRGHAAWTARIDPYGQAVVDAGNKVELSLRFPGHYHDAETGLFYNRYRYYSPELGRYLQSDPVGLAGGLNVYGYSGGAPLTAVDLVGHHEEQPENNGTAKGATAAGAVTEEEPEQSSAAPSKPPPLTRKEGQDIIDDIHKAYNSKLNNANTCLSQTEDGTLIVTSSDTVRPSQRDKIAEMQQPGGPLEGRTVLVPDDPKNPGAIPRGQRNLENAPNPERSGDAEQKGIQASNSGGEYDKHGDVTDQWTSGGAKHGGAACQDCEKAQNLNGVTNQTGFQSQGGRYDRGGTDPYQSGNSTNDDGSWK